MNYVQIFILFLKLKNFVLETLNYMIIFILVPKLYIRFSYELFINITFFFNSNYMFILIRKLQ